MTQSLFPIERAVVEKILTGDYPTLLQLRHQLEVCTVATREFTGVGFYTTFEVPETAPRTAGLDVTFGDVVGDLPGVSGGVGFLLYVKDGLLDTLEGYTYDERWPLEIGAFSLRYVKGDVRDLNDVPLLLRKADKGPGSN